MELFKVLSQLDVSPLPQTTADQAALDNIFGIVFGIAASIAVVIVVYGGVRFIASRGNSSEVVKARSIVLYGLVGLAVILLAFSIVTFTIGI